MTDTELLAKAIDRLAAAVEQGVLAYLDKPKLNDDNPDDFAEMLPPNELAPAPTAPPPEFAPIPSRTNVPQGEVVSSIPQQPQGLCPVHHGPWSKLVPAGVSKKTGNTYPAFWACPETGCNEKPRR
jgi:hypothetical protein